MPKNIAVTGGKGGTGKSTVATAIFKELSKQNKTLLVDTDVDCPNDHLILGLHREKVKSINQTIPKINKDKCMKCGRCGEVCRENAIIQIKDKFPIVIPEQCIGCNACMIACPYKAIDEDQKKIGTIYKSHNFMSAETEIGVEEESPIVNVLKEEVNKIEKNYDYIIYDTSPGTHCNVISALQGCNLTLVVSEPTPLGEHDTKLSLQLLEKLDLPHKLIINKQGISDKDFIKPLADEFNIEIIGSIPYMKDFIKQYSHGKTIEDESIRTITEKLK